MWKAAVGNQVNIKDNAADDDWDTDPDFINDVTEQEQRWGSKTVEGSGRNAGAIDMAKLRKETEESDAIRKKKELDEGPQASYGYGGKFGVQADRMDKSAMGHDYIAKVEKHVSQKDYSSGFGGKYGVQTDRVDKSAVTWDHKEKVEKHSSQKDYSTGFGGKFGVQADRQDQSAVGWDHVEQMNKHESQKDYSVGFGGKFGVQSDRQDKCAVGWDHHEAPQKHESQTDHKIGFGGKFGLQTDRMDKSASSFNEEPDKVGTAYTKVKPEIGNAKPSSLRAKFEKMSEETHIPQTESPKPVPKQNIQAKSVAFTQPKQEEYKRTVETVKQLDQTKTEFFTRQQSQPNAESTPEHVPKPLDHSKMQAFTERRDAQETINQSSGPKQLDMSKMAMFSNKTEPTVVSTSSKQLQQELEEIKEQQRRFEEQQVIQEEVKPSVSHVQAPAAPIIEQASSSTVQVQPSSSAVQVLPTSSAVQVLPSSSAVQVLPSSSAVQVLPSSSAVQVQAAAIQEQASSSAVQEHAAAVHEQAAAVPDEYLEEETEITLEDTGLTAVALYDYQAAAEDEISFDPDDVITHVEMIDEGWWRGLCRNQYGLFPANYVQLQQ